MPRLKSGVAGGGKDRPRLVAVIPAYNEERFIGSVVLRTREFVDSVVVADDGSRDATGEIAEAAGAMVVRHRDNLVSVAWEPSSCWLSCLGDPLGEVGRQAASSHPGVRSDRGLAPGGGESGSIHGRHPARSTRSSRRIPAPR
jgi:cellulose synthase/poly-beta-1,6-N-acetylglucosamine synthase-like glycosyltransferase